MRPIPVAFHIGPLEVHTYGIGLAVTFWFGFVYFERRLRKQGYPTDWLVPVFLWIILAAVVGARAMHVLSNLSTYTQRPGDILAVWQGGLSSFGGLLLAVPVGIILTRRRCPELPIARALDLAVPVLMACWAMGRLLGPQLWWPVVATRRTNGSGCTTPTSRGGGCPCPSSRRSRTSPST